MADAVDRHVDGILWVRERLLGMDDVAHPVMGIGDWDDAACVDFRGRLLASADGPYAKRLVLKSALVHAATDVAVKGGEPLFALDTLIGPEADVREMLESLASQAEAMRIPILGGNTLIEDAEARASITVLGRLLTPEPIRDCSAAEGDVIALVGDPIWGELPERMEKAKALFGAWREALGAVRFTSAKDVTKGGLSSVVREMERKSGRRFGLDGPPPYPAGRSLDNFIVTMGEAEYQALERICAGRGVRVSRIGTVG
jgi:selenophosphate synthetase-related protein